MPSQVTVSSIQAIAYLGPIGWVHPNIGWFQVQVTTAQAGVVTGYMQRTITTNLVVLPLFSCDLGMLPIPTARSWYANRNTGELPTSRTRDIRKRPRYILPTTSRNGSM